MQHKKHQRVGTDWQGPGGMWYKLLEGKTCTLGKNKAVPNVFISVKGLMMQTLTDEWTEVFRLTKILK
jgi:hypothetical protein